MLVDNSVLVKYLEKAFVDIMLSKKNMEIEMYDYAYEKYNLSKVIFADCMSGRRSIMEVSNFTLFVLLDSLNYVRKKNAKFANCKKISDFFTEKEIKDFSESKFNNDDNSKIEWPLTFDMIQVTDDQWIGAIDIDMLIKIMDNQLINYNPETQRAMQKVSRKGREYYKIAINKNAVNSIEEDIIDGVYIPSALTFNMAEDDDKLDFRYDPSNKKLIINSISAFDINDGYHRYLALLAAKRKDEYCNQVMELRITNFSVEKSQRHIYQEAQKTKMSTVDTNSYNVYDAANIVTKKINESSTCNINSMIGRYNCPIDYASFANCIHIIFFKNHIKKEMERKYSIKLSKELIDDFNILTETDEKFLSMKYDVKDIVIILYVFSLYENKAKNDMVEVINKALSKKEELESQRFYPVRKTTIKTVEKMIKEV